MAAAALTRQCVHPCCVFNQPGSVRMHAPMLCFQNALAYFATVVS